MNSKDDDSVPAMLTPGEVIVPKRMTAGNGGSGSTVHFTGNHATITAGGVGGAGGGGGGAYAVGGAVNIVPGSVHFISWEYEPRDLVTHCGDYLLRVVPASW